MVFVVSQSPHMCRQPRYFWGRVGRGFSLRTATPCALLLSSTLLSEGVWGGRSFPPAAPEGHGCRCFHVLRPRSQLSVEMCVNLGIHPPHLSHSHPRLSKSGSLKRGSAMTCSATVDSLICGTDCSSIGTAPGANGPRPLNPTLYGSHPNPHPEQADTAPMG
jgi:hypothetical protein